MILSRYWLRLLVAVHHSVSPEALSRGARRAPWVCCARAPALEAPCARGESSCGLAVAEVVQKARDSSPATTERGAPLRRRRFWCPRLHAEESKAAVPVPKRAITAEISTVPIANKSFERSGWTAVYTLPFSSTKSALALPKKDDTGGP
jgi:hypothetical protein